MQTESDILTLLKEKSDEMARRMLRAAILQPGAIGDCILTLPLAKYIKDSLGLGAIDIIGHTDYIGIFPGRTCVDSVRSIDTMDLHRLFTHTDQFDPADPDPLIDAFAAYTWIVTFLGQPDGNFERNLIFTANCSHSAEVVTLPAKQPAGDCRHIADFYVRQFAHHAQLDCEQLPGRCEELLISPTQADRQAGAVLLRDIGIDTSQKPVVIHPGSGGRKKCWHLDNFLQLAQRLSAAGLEPLFLLGPAETARLHHSQTRKINAAAKCLTDLSLTQVLQVLACATAFIGNDSGISHLAAALGARTLAIFGPTDPNIYRPIGPDVRVLAADALAATSKDIQQEILRHLGDL